MDGKRGLDEKWVTNVMKQQHNNSKLGDVIGIVAEPATAAGGNYLSVVTRVKILAYVACGAKKTISLILKQAKTSEEDEGVTAGFGAFQTETKMYTTVLNHMEALMDEFEDTRDILWPKLYGAVPYNTLALEDLKQTGYKLVDRTRWQGLDHAFLVLRSLGRYHAMSKVLMSQGLIGEAEKGHYWDNMPFMRNYVEGALITLSKCMARQVGYWPSGWEGLARRILAISPKIVDKLIELHVNYDKRFETLCHGDVWSTNMMFKEMEYTNLPISMKFLDFQLCFLSSFACDVSYFMYSSIKPSVRRAHKPDLLKAYHQSLVDNLAFYDWQGEVPTLDDVIQEDQRLLPAALYAVLTVMPISTATCEDALALEKVVSGIPEEAFSVDAFSEEKFVIEVGDDIKEFAKLSII